MKKNLLNIAGAFTLVCFAACSNGSEETTTTDSSSASTMSSEPSMSSSTTSTVRFDPSASYVDLSSGKPIKVRVDTVTKYIVNEVTNQPIMYFVNPATRDTFDRGGRIVNNALIRGTSGDYTIDEARISMSNDNSNMNTDNADMTTTDTVTMSGNEQSTGKYKEKIKDDKYKVKTDDSKLKIKDNKIKAKTDPE